MNGIHSWFVSSFEWRLLIQIMQAPYILILLCFANIGYDSG